MYRPPCGDDCCAASADTTVFRDLPAVPFEPCEKRASKVSSTALMRYRSNDYSTTTAFGFLNVLVESFVDEVVHRLGRRGGRATSSSIRAWRVRLRPQRRPIWRLSSGNPAHSTRRHRCRAGPCRRACSIYVGCSSTRMGDRGKRVFIELLLADGSVPTSRRRGGDSRFYIRLARSASTPSSNSSWQVWSSGRSDQA